MTIDIHSKEGQIIRQLIPLSTMPISQFTSLCQNISLEDASENSFLFKKNDTENDLIYLIDGSITLQSKELKVEIVKSGTESSRFALAHQIPRKIDAYSNTAVRFLRLNPDIINALPSISYEESASYMVIDEPDDENNDDDWMTTLLKSPIFRALPPANLQQIIISLHEVAFKKGDSIIKQGDPGDYYYLIKNGHCLISRKPSANAKDIKLAQLRTQDTFGEDSLLSGEPRNVSITALTDITLLRLSKDKFISLIKDPSLKYISHAQIKDKLSNGAILIDVRSPDEYNKHHLPDSINTPFFSLRMQLKTLNKKKPVIVVCANGKTSEAAAFLLLRHKFKALIIEGGMEQEQPRTSEAPAAFAIDDGFETLSADTPDFEYNTQDSIEASADKNDQQNSLQLENQQLKQKIQNLTAEKIEQKKKYRVLFKQTEKMKAILDGLKNGGGGDS
jgi:rhodanese-related sulfurtransferase